MKDLRDYLDRTLQAHGGAVDLVVSGIITLCAVAIFAAVFVNFMRCGRSRDVKRERKSVVATGSMILFFVVLYALIRGQIGVVSIPDPLVRTGMAAAGLAIIVFGCAVNILGRLRLGRNWANQATIYGDQGLIVTGVYAWVRHPLYASLIWMFYGASLVYANAAAFLATTLIFVPFMTYRARLEEEMLAREFKDYADYRRRVGMFFYKPARGRRMPRGERT